jgi:hypothetical protein
MTVTDRPMSADGPAIDKEALRTKYRQERDKRLRPDGNTQYQRLTGARLQEAGVNDVRIVERAGGFGGTWYWNRYPGAQCDTASYVYMPLLEETGHMPTEKYAHGPEILEH